MGLIEIASGNSVWRGMDYYNNKKVSKQDRAVILAIKNDETKVSEICKKVGMTSSVFSRYRDRLIKRGIIISSGHGYVSLLLPRFEIVAKTYE